MIKKEIKVINKLGIHSRPTAMIVLESKKFQSDLTLRKGEIEAKCNSILDIMMLAAERGTSLELISEGEDEESAISAIEALFLNRFNEKE